MSGGTYIPKRGMAQKTQTLDTTYQMMKETYHNTYNRTYEQGNNPDEDEMVQGYRKATQVSFRNLMREQVPSIIDVTRTKNVPIRRDAYSKSEAKKKRKEYGKAASKGKVYQVNMHDFADSLYMDDLFSEKVENCEYGVKTQRDLYKKCKEGVFNDFEKLDPILRDTLAIEYTREKIEILLRDNDSLEDIVDTLDELMGHEGLAHPLLRLGISLGMRGQAKYDGLKAEDCKKLEDRKSVV